MGRQRGIPRMGTRRQGREWVLQLLFQVDLNPSSTEDTLKPFWEERPDAEPATREFAERLFLGTVSHRDELDATMRRYVQNWSIKRMGVVDRNVLRMALYELMHCEDIPPVVTINEAVDLAKFFSNTESGRFVNGVLDRVRKDLKREARAGTKESPDGV
jgi:N utilization substance protein B